MTKIQAIDKDILEKLNGLKQVHSTKDMLQGLRQQEKLDKVLVVMLDTSGSMADIMDMSRKIEVAWQVFHVQLMPHMANWSYGILGFSNTAYWIAYPSPSNQLPAQVPCIGGGTSMGEALIFTWAWIKSNANQCRIILLSDGWPTDMSNDEILDMARENANIPIDTVGVGAGSNSYDPMFLRQLSKITGGVFSQASSVAQLVDTVKKLSPEARPLLGKVKE